MTGFYDLMDREQLTKAGYQSVARGNRSRSLEISQSSDTFVWPTLWINHWVKYWLHRIGNGFTKLPANTSSLDHMAKSARTVNDLNISHENLVNKLLNGITRGNSCKTLRSNRHNRHKHWRNTLNWQQLSITNRTPIATSHNNNQNIFSKQMFCCPKFDAKNIEKERPLYTDTLTHTCTVTHQGYRWKMYRWPNGLGFWLRPASG